VSRFRILVTSPTVSRSVGVVIGRPTCA